MICLFKDRFSFLSNFYPCIISDTTEHIIKKDIPELNITNVEYELKYHFNFPSAEHYYQSLKTNSIEEKVKILLCKSPGKAKFMGAELTIIPNWEEKRIGFMTHVVSEKFKQNQDLIKLLTDTYPEKIIEGNFWHDNFWGKCFCEDCRKNIAQNKLGIILMKIRQQYL